MALVEQLGDDTLIVCRWYVQLNVFLPITFFIYFSLISIDTLDGMIDYTSMSYS